MKAFSLLLSLFAAVMLRATESNPPKLPSGAQFAGDVAYVAQAHARQKMDIAFFKHGPQRPLLVWVHGGAFKGGDKAENLPIWDDLMNHGFAVATINYRLSGDAQWPAQITDCKAAIRFLKANAKQYNIDPLRIAVWGSSAGGHLAALVGASGGEKKFDVGEHLDQSSAVSCAVDMFGPIDFEKMPLRNSPTSPEAKMWGRSTVDALEMAREACPLTYLSKDTPPLLILHGDADTVISIGQSQLFHAALQRAGATSELITVPGVGHSQAAVWAKERERICAFFDRHLKREAGANTKTHQPDSVPQRH